MELFGQFPADLVEDDGVVDVDCVAGEVNGVRLGDDDAFGGWVEGFDGGDGGGVEGFGVVHDVAVCQWREAGVEVVETWIDEVKRDDLDVPDFAKEMMAGGGGAGTVAGPEAGAVGGEESVAFAFEGEAAGDVKDRVASVLEPATEVLLFVLTFGVEEAAEGYDSVALESGIGGKDHVG